MRSELQAGHSSRQAVEKTVGQLVMLTRSDEACRLLGVEGVLVDQVDITILDDPLDYVAYDIAAALRDADDDSVPATMLSTLVAELRLCGLITAHIVQADLVERVIRQLEEESS